MQEKTHWPGESKLKELRDEGKVPFSALTLNCIRAIAVLLAAYVSAGAVTRLWHSYSSLIPPLGGALDRGELKKVGVDAFEHLLVLPIVGLLAGIIGVLIQTKFLLHFGEFKFDLARISPLRAWTTRYSLGSLLRGLAWSAASLALGLLVAAGLSSDVYLLLNNDLGYFVGWGARLAKALLPVILISMVALGAVAWLLAKFKFMRAHRMTRQEAQQYMDS